MNPSAYNEDSPRNKPPPGRILGDERIRILYEATPSGGDQRIPSGERNASIKRILSVSFRRRSQPRAGVSSNIVFQERAHGRRTDVTFSRAEKYVSRIFYDAGRLTLTSAG